MENKGPEFRNSAHFFHSQWLQTTVSDLDDKLKGMMTILEDGHASDQEDDIHHKRRQDLMKMLEEFSKSYHALAIAYHQLRAETSHTVHLGSAPSSSNKTKSLCPGHYKRVTDKFEDQKFEKCFHSHTKSSSEKYSVTTLDFGKISKLDDDYHELNSIKLLDKNKCSGDQTDFFNNEDISMETEFASETENAPMIHNKSDKMWPELEIQITELTDDSEQQLVELVKRNDEKRETIKSLRFEVEALKSENRALKNSFRYPKADAAVDQPRIRRSRRLLIGNLLRCCPS